MKIVRLSFLVAILLTLHICSAYADADVPYDINERLEFDISYFGVIGGTTVLEVKGINKVGERDAYHVVSTARTNDFFDKVYRVRDVIETYIDTEKLYSLKLKINQNEGKSKSRDNIIFDQENHKAIHLKKHGRKTVYNMIQRVQDSLSSVFYVRTRDLKVGEDIVFNTYASRKSWKLIVKVLKRETVKVAAGTFKTVLVKPILKYNDVFINKGDVYIWLSDDDRKIPVKLKSKVIVGAFTAELTKQPY